MSTLLDILGATILVGMIILTVLQLNTSFMDANYQHSFKTVTQESVAGIDGTDNTAGIARILESDFTRMGYNIDTTRIYGSPLPAKKLWPYIDMATRDSIRFFGDFENNGSVDYVRYFTALPAYTSRGNNPKLKLLYRREDKPIAGADGGLGVSQFVLSYFDSLGRVVNTGANGTNNLAQIRSIKIQLMVESAVRMQTQREGKYDGRDTTYAAMYWERVISPKYLQRSL